MSLRVTVDEFRAAMGSFAAGVAVVTTVDPTGAPAGLTVTAFASVSKDPPLCLVSVARDADAHPALSASGRFAVNMLTRSQEALSARFATHGADKFGGVPYRPGEATGCPLLADALCAVECRVTSVAPAGDHDVFIGSIERVHLRAGDDPLLYFRGRYRGLAP